METKKPWRNFSECKTSTNANGNLFLNCWDTLQTQTEKIINRSIPQPKYVQIICFIEVHAIKAKICSEMLCRTLIRTFNKSWFQNHTKMLVKLVHSFWNVLLTMRQTKNCTVCLSSQMFRAHTREPQLDSGWSHPTLQNKKLEKKN